MNLPSTSPLFPGCTLNYNGSKLTVKDQNGKIVTHYVFNGFAVMTVDDLKNFELRPITESEMSRDLYDICKPLIHYSVEESKARDARIESNNSPLIINGQTQTSDNQFDELLKKHIQTVQEAIAKAQNHESNKFTK